MSKHINMYNTSILYILSGKLMMGQRHAIEMSCCGDSTLGSDGDLIRVVRKGSSGSNKLLGEGSFGTVFQAKVLESRKEKGMALEKAKVRRKGDDYGVDGAHARRFACKRIVCKDDTWVIATEHEIKMHRLCGTHPNILSLLATACVNEGHGVRVYYMLLPLCCGSIQDAIDKAPNGTSAFTMKDCLEIFAELAGAVQAMHDTGFTHRDIKPANIMFLPSGRPQLMDLGSCALVREHVRSMKEAAMLADTAAEKSTPTYRAPELFDCTHLIPHCVGPETDVWSLGCLLYAMAFGRSPFEFGPHGSFERLAVMNSTLHFEGHATPVGLENVTWSNKMSAWNNTKEDPTCELSDLTVVETPGFVNLLRVMLDPNPYTRIRLKDAVYVASWKVGKPEEENFMLGNAGSWSDITLKRDGTLCDSGSGTASKQEYLQPHEKSRNSVWEDGKDVEEENEQLGTAFEVDWNSAKATAKNTIKKKKKKKKTKKKKQNTRTSKGLTIQDDSDVVGHEISEERRKESFEEDPVSMDESDEFGDFTTSPPPKLSLNRNT